MPTVYGMKENQIKRVAKKDNWMSLEQWATKAFEVYMEENNATEILRLKSLKDEVSWVADLAALLTRLQLTISEDCLLGELMAFVGADKSTKSAEKILAMARMLKYNVDSDDDNSSSELLRWLRSVKKNIHLSFTGSTETIFTALKPML